MCPVHYLQFFIFTTCIHFFTLFIYLVYYSDLFASKFRNEILYEYDYVIVGSGTAGSLIAYRIATETNYSFIVLEAGSKSHTLLDIPVLGPLLQGSMYDWQYETVPQMHACHAMVDQKCKLPQGKILGGSAKMNNMIHVRGNLSHYTQWFHGRHSEEYVRQQFDFIEHNILHVSDLQFESKFPKAVLDGVKELGYKILDSEFGQGFMKAKVSQKDGKRWSTSSNLHVNQYITNAFVEKVIIKENSARGVEFQLAGTKKKVYARKGIILSAGAINTPKILQLSGIGPSSELKSLKIPVVKDLPVGKNLQDHVITGLDLILLNKSLDISPDDLLNPFNIYKYFIHGRGPLTSTGCEAVGFISSKKGASPDFQLSVLPIGLSSDRSGHLRKQMGIKDEVWEKYFVKIFEKYVAMFGVTILHPKSRGEVIIQSTDHNKTPLINPNYLAHSEDRKIMVNGLKLVSKLMETKAMRAIEAYLNPLPIPGCEQYTLFTNSYWECYIKHFSTTHYHPVGTCSMGLRDSKEAVVDTSFKVIGIDKLFVSDGSVLPTLPSANINTAIALMASIFFDSNIAAANHVGITAIDQRKCFKTDLLNEYIFNVCFNLRYS